MRVLCSAVLLFEAVVIALAIPVAITVSGVPGATAGWIGGALAVLCLVAAGLLRSRVGYVLGWLVQVGLIAAGFAAPEFWYVALLFGALWILALRLGPRAERIRAQRVAEVEARERGPIA
jgi:hypothetical protein